MNIRKLLQLMVIKMSNLLIKVNQVSRPRDGPDTAIIYAIP